VPAGYIVRITARRVGDSQQEFWQVAIEDENRAKEWVRQASGVASDAIVETVKELSASDIGPREI
jgi:hypothetical protein